MHIDKFCLEVVAPQPLALNLPLKGSFSAELLHRRPNASAHGYNTLNALLSSPAVLHGRGCCEDWCKAALQTHQPSHHCLFLPHLCPCAREFGAKGFRPSHLRRPKGLSRTCNHFALEMPDSRWARCIYEQLLSLYSQAAKGAPS